MASNDTVFVAHTTPITAAWVQPVNDLVHKGRNPNYAVSTGSGTAYTVTLPAGALYTTAVAGDTFTWKCHLTNTGAATLTVVGASGTAYPLVAVGGAPLVAGNITAGSILRTTFDGTSYQTTVVSVASGAIALMPGFKDSGAIGNGVANDTAAITAALGSIPVWSNPGTYLTTWATGAAVTGRYFGVGRVKTADGNLRGPWFSSVTARPGTLGNDNSVDTAFNGDLSRVQLAMEHRITGAGTLGTPATGYLYTNETMAAYLNMYNTSGWNQSTGGNNGRTAAVAMRVQVNNYGQGDCMAYNAVANVFTTKAGSTDVLANPAASILAGDCGSFIAGGYCNPVEIDCADHGFDSAAAGAVFNMDRSVSTAAKKAFWSGVRVQSTGAANIDSAYYASGPMKVGLNLAAAAISGATLAAVAFKANNRVYFNASDSGVTYDSVTYGTEYMSYSSGTSTLSIAVADQPNVQVKSNQVLVSGTNGFFVVPDSVNTKFFVDGTYTRSKNQFICVPGGGVDANASITATTSTLYLGNQAQGIPVEINGTVKYTGTGLSSTSVGTAGAATALPAFPVGYWRINLNGTTYQVPYYNL